MIHCKLLVSTGCAWILTWSFESHTHHKATSRFSRLTLRSWKSLWPHHTTRVPLYRDGHAHFWTDCCKVLNACGQFAKNPNKSMIYEQKSLTRPNKQIRRTDQLQEFLAWITPLWENIQSSPSVCGNCFVPEVIGWTYHTGMSMVHFSPLRINSLYDEWVWHALREMLRHFLFICEGRTWL